MLWIKSLESLYDIGQLRYFVPDYRMNWEEQANAVVRFTIYLSFLMYLYHNNAMVLIFPTVLIMLIQYYLFREGKLPSVMANLFGGGSLKEGFILRADDYLEREYNDELQSQEQLNQLLQKDLHEGVDQEHRILDLEENPTMADAREFERSSLMNSATPLTSQNLDEIKKADLKGQEKQRKTLLTSLQKEKPELGLEYPEPEFRPKSILAKKTTESNPFGNPLPYDSIDQQIYPMDPNQNEINAEFNRNLFSDIDDVWDRNNSQRQFTTVPASQRINDREAFMQFLFNTPYTEY